MRIALIGAEFEENLAVRYVRGALEAAGHEVLQIVFNGAEETKVAAEALASSGAELAGLSMVFTYRAREFARLAVEARELGFRGHIVGGGHFAAFNAAEILRDVPAIDSIALGEGEDIARDLAASLCEPWNVKGLVWRTAGGEIVHNAPAVKPPDLDALPLPSRKDPFDLCLGIPIVNMLSSRGCYRACAFCSIAAWHRMCGGPRFRMRRLEAVAEEMADLYRRGVRIFNFHDDNFFLPGRAENIERARALGHAMERARVGPIAFAVKSRPDTVDRELFAILKSMGLFRVFLGIEAGTADSLRYLGRGQTREDNERALEVLDELDLHAPFNLLLWNPDSTLEDVAGNVAFLREHPRHPMNFCRTEIYAGTPLEAKLRREGRLQGSYWGYDYVIADPRAELAYEIARRAFWERNYGERGIHHLAMSLDFERQLLTRLPTLMSGQETRSSHPPADEILRRSVKDFIAEVNLNTCEYLEEVLSAAAGSPADAEGLARELAARVHADDRRLWRRGSALLGENRARGRSESRIRGRGWVRVATAAGLAAAVALGAEGCERRTQAFEVAAAPTADDTAMRALAVRDILPTLAAKLGAAAPIEVEMTVDSAGRIEVFRAQVLGAQRPGSKEPIPVAASDLSDISIDTPHARGRHYSFIFFADEVRNAMDDTHEEPDGPKPGLDETGDKIDPTYYTEFAPSSPRDDD